MSKKEFECKIWKPIEKESVILSKTSFNDFGFDKHIHEEYAIGVVSEGIMDISFDGTNKSINKKSLMTFNPDTMHSNWSINKNSYSQMAIYLHPSFISNFIEKNFNSKEIFFRTKLLENETLANELISLIEEYENDNLTILEYECRLIDLLNKIVLNNSAIINKNKTSNNVISKAKEFMQDSIELDITLDDISKELNISKFYFAKLFKEHTHFSPHAYLMIKRLEKAKQLLQTKADITTVAQDCGFTDQSHLNKRFKKYLGITPKTYQKFFK